MDKARAIIDYAQNDEGTQAREALYQAINDRVMAHIESQKQEIAKGLLQPQEHDPLSTTSDEAV